MHYTAEQIAERKVAFDLASETTKTLRKMGKDVSVIIEGVPLKESKYVIEVWTPDVLLTKWYAKDIADVRIKIGRIINAYKKAQEEDKANEAD